MIITKQPSIALTGRRGFVSYTLDWCWMGQSRATGLHSRWDCLPLVHWLIASLTGEDNPPALRKMEDRGIFAHIRK